MSDQTTKSTEGESAAKPSYDANAGAVAVGVLLAKTRVASGQDIVDVAQTLRISKRYLVALEEGRAEDLPANAYAIGFVRSYAEHLDLDADEVVRRFKAGADDAEARTDLTFPKPIPEGGVPGGPMLLVGFAVAVLAYGIWSFTSSDDVEPERVAELPQRLAETLPKTQSEAETSPSRPQADRSVLKQATKDKTLINALKQEPAPKPEPAPEPEPVVEPVAEPVTPAQPEPSSVLEAFSETTDEEQPEAETTPEPVVEVQPTPEPAPEPAKPTSRIQVRAKTNSWIQVRDETEGKLLFTRLLRKGDVYDVPARDGLTLLTGNAGALDILVDGNVVPAIGYAGDVRRNVALDPEKLIAGTAVND